MISTFDVTGRRVLAILPHQDDEVIGLGGRLAWAVRNALSVHLVLATDGAADGGVKSVLGHTACARLCNVVDKPTPGIIAHDATLVVDGDGTPRHRWTSPPPFPIHSDPDRAPGFECPVWGRQRDIEFLQVAATLGIPRENIVFAYWDPECPAHIKDGQTGINGESLGATGMAERYERLARHYIDRLRPDVIFTMAPYEYMDAPNDHWAIGKGVEAAAADRVGMVKYSHSGFLYMHLMNGGSPEGDAFALSDELWDIKRRALMQYFQWDPARGLFATAAHSVPNTFKAILSSFGRVEYLSDEPVIFRR